MNFFSLGIRKTTLVFKDASGLFWKDRYKPLLEAGSNLLFSIPLAIHFGIAGTIIGTIITNILVSGIIEAHITYKYLFKRSVWLFFREEIKYYVILILSLAGCSFITSSIGEISFVNVLIRGFISIGFSVMVLIVLFFRTEEYRYAKSIVLGLIRKAYRR